MNIREQRDVRGVRLDDGCPSVLDGFSSVLEELLSTATASAELL